MSSSGKNSVIRILHVDDDPSILEFSKLMLMDIDSSFEIDHACCVDEALQKLSSEKYDIVVSDFEMPQKDGLQLLKELREQKNKTPFVLFTGKGREEVAIKALNLGADAYHDKQGSPETVFGELTHSLKTVVARHKAENALSESEKKYRTLVEQSTQGLLLGQGPIPHIVYANSAMSDISGYSVQELTSFTFQQLTGLVHPDDRELFFSRFRERLQGKPTTTSYVVRGINKDGTITWFELSSALIEYGGQPTVQAVFTDITERKKAEEVIYESEKRYRELANSLPNIVFETDPNGQLEFANKSAEEISGYSLGEIKDGINILQFVVPEDREKAKKNMQRLLAGGSYNPAEYTFLRKNGTTFPALITATRRFHENKVTGLSGLVLDISERKKIDEAMRKSEARYRELANFLPEIVFEADRTGRITFFSQKAFEITGFTPKEIEKGMNMLSFVVPEEDQEIAKDRIKRALLGEKLDGHEYTLYRKNGETFPAIVKTAPIISENKVAGIRGIVIDITERKNSELQLKRYNEVLERVSEGIDAGLAVINKDYRVVWANRRLMDLGVAPNKKCYETFNNIGVVCPDCGVEKIFKNDAPFDVHEYKTVNSKGETTWIELRVTPLKDQNGVTMAALELAVPITERKKTEQILRESEEKFRKAFETSPDACYIGTVEDGVIIEVNDAFSRVWGYSNEECVGKTSLQLGLYAKGSPDRQRMLSELKSKGHFSNLEFDGKRKNGEVFPLLFSGTVLEMNGKRLIYGILRDITERKKAEDALLKAEAHYRGLFDNIDEGFELIEVIRDEKGEACDFRYLEVNGAFEKQTGVKVSGVLGKTTSELFPGFEHYWLDVFGGVEKTSKPASFENYSEPLHRYYQTYAFPFGKNQIGVLFRDVTDYKKAEEELRAVSLYTRSLIDASLDPLVTISKEGKITDVNKAAELATGCSREELVGSDFSSYFTDPERARAGYKKVFTEGFVKDYPLGIKHKSGRVIDVLYNASVYCNLQGEIQGVFAAARDITERKKAEEELRKSIKKYQLLFEGNLDGIIVGKRDGRIVSANPALCKMLGMSEQEVLAAGRQGIVVDDRRNDEALMEQDERGEVVARLSFRRKDGSTFEAEISSKEIVDFDGSTSLLVAVRDISNRLMLEDKLKTIGSFTRHDINNKLSSAGVHLYLSKKLVVDKPEIKKSLDHIEANLNSISRILEVSKEYETIGSQELRQVDVGKALDEAVSLFATLKGISVTNSVSGCNVLADQMLTTLFYNLIDNTIKYGEKTTRIDVYIQENEDGSESIVFEDDGVGISATDKLRVFEKGFGKGSGYGLFLIKKTCEIYGWAITETGEPGKGAKFGITISNQCKNAKKLIKWQHNMTSGRVFK